MSRKLRLIQVDHEFINLAQLSFARFNPEDEELTLWILGYSEPIFYKGERAVQVRAAPANRAKDVTEEPGGGGGA